MPHLPDRHHDHDPALIAAFAAGDATGAEHATATRLVAACTGCATLRDDLVAIAAAVHALPAPRRTRDYRLTADQAATLRPAGWRRVLGALAGPRFRLAAPLGTTMATLGVAGLIVAAMSGGSAILGSPAGGEALTPGADPYGGSAQITGSSAQPEATDAVLAPASQAPASAPAPAAGATPPADGSPPAASPTALRQTTVPELTAPPAPAATPIPQAVDRPKASPAASAPWQPLALGSAALFALGAILVLGRVVARRASPA